MNKNLHLTIAWFLLAFLITLAAVWQAQLTIANESQAGKLMPPPPLKTRHAERSPRPDSPAESSGDPVADYTARRAKGLTDREIGWIVEDFQNAGLDLGIRATTNTEYLAQRKSQDRWYRDALVEAWSLTPAQSTQVTTRLSELYDRAKADFVEAFADKKPIEINGKSYIITGTDPIYRLIDADRRLKDESGAYLPWNLCEMSLDTPLPAVEEIPAADDFETPREINPIVKALHDPRLATVDGVLPPSTLPSEEAPIRVAPPLGAVLQPLRNLHPAQLKLLLLIEPERAGKIRAALDTGEQASN